MRLPVMVLTLGVLCVQAAHAHGTPGQSPVTSPMTAVRDPWPTAAVLTRLLTLPAAKADGLQMAKDLRLNSLQVSELRRLAASESAYGRAGRRVIGREEAARLNHNLLHMNQEKDRKVRVALGERYPAFRAWIREWWQTQVVQARS
ncbi:hypothetical protein ACFSC4_01285 [Deinococcus malanensis]|nr:hypothetical protein [Deinococcus malanensis]